MMMNKILVLLFVSLGFIECREMHPIKPDTDMCFDSYIDVQPINLSNLTKACVEPFPEINNCPGMGLFTDEVILLDCDISGNKRTEPLKTGCYTLIKKDSTEEVICQRYNRKKMCEMLKTPSNLAIEVYCQRSSRSIVNVERIKTVP
uniref:Uncharacterized protein LOC114329173 isoform X1 n=2 Tax=Diabrotica virgifera virgifera TaxID=50390 RepID=A0A6P7FE46_DIAVI